MITRVDKGNSILVIPTHQYETKIQNFILNNFRTATTDPSNTLEAQIRQTVRDSKTLIPKVSRWKYTNRNPSAPSIKRLIKIHKPTHTTNGSPPVKPRGHGTHCYNEISTPLPQGSPRKLHAFLYNWSESLVTTWRWPTYRAETCRCYNPPVILEANIVLLDCNYYYTKLLTTIYNISLHYDIQF